MRRIACLGILIVLLGACALARSDGPRERQQNDAPAKREDATVDQLQSIARELRAIREQQANAEQRAAEQQSKQGDGVYWPPIWSNWVLAIFAGGAAIIAAMSLGAIRRQVEANVVSADAARQSAEAAAEQARIMRLQLVGTLGAVVTSNVSLTSEGIHVNFGNSGRVTAKNIQGTVQITRVTVPSLDPIGSTRVHPIGSPTIGSEQALTYDFPVDTGWLPLKTSWEEFIKDPTTLKVEARFSYENGFGDVTEGQPLCRVFFAKWTVQTQRGSTGGGGVFLSCETVRETWDYANLRKQEEAQGIRREY